MSKQVVQTFEAIPYWGEGHSAVRQLTATTREQAVAQTKAWCDELNAGRELDRHYVPRIRQTTVTTEVAEFSV